MKKLTIERAKWANPSLAHGNSCLINHEGAMCCLGFAILACGVPAADLRGAGTPEDIESIQHDPMSDETGVDLFLNWVPDYAYEDDEAAGIQWKQYVSTNTELTRRAIEINDSCTMTLAEREEALASWFAEYGVELVFAGTGIASDLETHLVAQAFARNRTKDFLRI